MYNTKPISLKKKKKTAPFTLCKHNWFSHSTLKMPWCSEKLTTKNRIFILIIYLHIHVKQKAGSVHS